MLLGVFIWMEKPAAGEGLAQVGGCYKNRRIKVFSVSCALACNPVASPIPQK